MKTQASTRLEVASVAATTVMKKHKAGAISTIRDIDSDFDNFDQDVNLTLGYGGEEFRLKPIDGGKVTFRRLEVDIDILNAPNNNIFNVPQVELVVDGKSVSLTYTEVMMIGTLMARAVGIAAYG